MGAAIKAIRFTIHEPYRGLSQFAAGGTCSIEPSAGKGIWRTGFGNGLRQNAVRIVPQFMGPMLSIERKLSPGGRRVALGIICW